jgi:membrane protein YqaA with SNARE-associated domain
MHDTSTEHPPTIPRGPRGWLRRLYLWVLSWADSPYGMAGLAGISFAESSFFPIPPDVLQIALSVSRPQRAFLFAAISTVASVAGGALGWAIGWGLWQATSSFFFDWIPGFTEEHFAFVEQQYQANAGIAIFAAAFTPIPFKVFTIAAGACSVPLPTLLLASAAGRGLRFFLVAGVMRVFGEQAKRILNRNLELVTLVLGAMIVAGFVALRYLPGHN